MSTGDRLITCEACGQTYYVQVGHKCGCGVYTKPYYKDGLASTVDETETLRQQNKALIEDAERLAELLSIDIPPATEYEKKVARDVGDKYGYGAIMSALSNVWHIEKEHGENGAITIGHCYGTIKKVLQQHNDLMQEIGCSQK